MRIRTVWNWRLKLYPLIVIPWMVYLNAAPQETMFSHGSSSATASIATLAVAAPSVAASPSAVLWTFEAGPLMEFRMKLTNERG